MFRVAFHTSFLRGRTLTFYPRDIDGPHADVAHKRFLPEFKVVIVTKLSTKCVVSVEVCERGRGKGGREASY